jgi:catechol 2,3-dioxygenase-like lactoylglutathione lyase family enzyme
MKRFHVHVSVSNLDEGIRFYSTLFGAQPVRVESDYAKWMTEDPRINFAISQRQTKLGVDHLGFQVDEADELAEMKSQLLNADAGLVQQTAAACCYATADKYWVTDPAGIAWESFHTLGSIPIFGADTDPTKPQSCCEPVAPTKDGACCVPSSKSPTALACCV